MAAIDNEIFGKPERCYFCGADCSEHDIEGEYEHFCHGCSEFVCSDCDLDEPFGKHDVEEHRASAE